MAGSGTNSINREIFMREIVFTHSRSSGPGGQHVNKVSTKVELRFNILRSELLSEEEKAILSNKLKNKITKEGDLVIISRKERSQLKNKEIAIEKFIKLLKETLTPIKLRKETKPTRASREKRLEDKKLVSEKKDQRKKPDVMR